MTGFIWVKKNFCVLGGVKSLRAKFYKKQLTKLPYWCTLSYSYYIIFLFR